MEHGKGISAYSIYTLPANPDRGKRRLDFQIVNLKGMVHLAGDATGGGGAYHHIEHRVLPEMQSTYTIHLHGLYWRFKL
jgi:hypothetical protein